MAYNNFSVSRKMAQFYLKESQPTEGYQEVTYGEGKKTYHKYFRQVQGVPVYFGTKEVEYEGRTLRFLELTLQDGEDLNKISVSLRNKGGYTDEVRKLVSVLNSADLNEEIVISLKNNKYTNKKGIEKEDLQFYGNYVNRKNEEGRGESTGYIPFGEIPSPIKKTVAGETVWDWTPQTEFFYQKIQEIEERFKNKDTHQKPTASSKVKEAVTDDNELPF